MKRKIYSILIIMFILFLIVIGILGYADGVEEQIVDKVIEIEKVNKKDIKSEPKLEYSDDCHFGALIKVKEHKDTYLFCRKKDAKIYFESIGNGQDQYLHKNQLYKEAVIKR